MNKRRRYERKLSWWSLSESDRTWERSTQWSRTRRQTPQVLLESPPRVEIKVLSSLTFFNIYWPLCARVTTSCMLKDRRSGSNTDFLKRWTRIHRYLNGKWKLHFFFLNGSYVKKCHLLCCVSLIFFSIYAWYSNDYLSIVCCRKPKQFNLICKIC